MIDPNVLISDVLKHFTGQLTEFIPLSVDEMAEIASGAACRPMEVATRHCTIVASFDKLVRVRWWVRCELSLLDFIRLLKFLNGLVSQSDELIVSDVFVFAQ